MKKVGIFLHITYVFDINRAKFHTFESKGNNKLNTLIAI